MKKRIIIAAFAIFLLIGGYFFYENTKQVGYLQAGYVPNQEEYLLNGDFYIQLINLKGNKASYLFGDKEEKGNYKKTEKEIIIHFPEEKMVLQRARSGEGTYVDVKTKIEYGFYKK
ncbi:MAG: hypothetical protein LBV67_11985 [Streptococcaceae bacterium]|jgi:hypothetical protein|nr:hypothetical protein [Streptococcaceae bacterium]